MNHQAIDFLARERINGLAREAAASRLAHGGRPAAEGRWLPVRSALGGRLRATIVRGGAVVGEVLARVARAQGAP